MLDVAGVAALIIMVAQLAITQMQIQPWVDTIFLSFLVRSWLKNIYTFEAYTGSNSRAETYKEGIDCCQIPVAYP